MSPLFPSTPSPSARPRRSAVVVARLAAFVACALAGCTWVHPTEPVRPLPAGTRLPVFDEIPVAFSHRWDHETSHHLTGGAALDVDGDGRTELFVGGGQGQPDALLAYRDGRLVDVIDGTGLSSDAATYGSIAIDLDGDGDVDLAVARNDGVTLYRNDGGRFAPQPLDVSLPEDSVVLAISATDLERDGDVDLYLSVFVDFPHFRSATFNVPAHAKPNRLLRNDGGLRFTDVTNAATASHQNTFTSAFVDLDGDGLQDLVVAQNTGPVEILRSLGDGEFEPIAPPTGYGFWMGVAVGDADGDADPDLLFTNVGDSFPGFLARGDLHDDQPYAGGWALLRNDGGMHFSDETGASGLAGLGFAWGAVFEDVDLDGHLDVVAAQNYVKWPVHHLFKFPGKVLLKTPNDGFVPAPVARNESFGTSPLFADLDGDGRLDLFWLNSDGPSRAFLNKTPGNAVVVALPDDARSLGARARLAGVIAGPVRELVSGTGLGTDHAPILVLGLGAATEADELVVTWADGRETRIAHPPLNVPIRVAPDPSMRAASAG